MKILVTNDDGYRAQGIQVLVKILKQFGDVTVIAPKYHQSGMASAVTMGFKPIAVKDLGMEDGVHWMYVDASPASCVKYATSIVYPTPDLFPDIVVCGINHGSNAAGASVYSGTLGAAEEAAIRGIPAIGVSLDDMHSVADFSPVEAHFPTIFKKIISDHKWKQDTFFNVNFPAIPADQVKGVRVCHQGFTHWEDEYEVWDPSFFEKRNIDLTRYGLKSTEVEHEEGEKIYLMVGTQKDEQRNDSLSDHRCIAEGYATIVMHTLDTTDHAECAKLREEGFDIKF
ncbi:MAG: 5'/3'-nucleotidase SurE [Bacteroidales bacterium]|nr:5'/3'-nucleotidase SurE [Bacteroidales bacterium]